MSGEASQAREPRDGHTSGTEGQRLLDVSDLRVYFPVGSGFIKAVDGVSLDVSPGERIGLVGESGSGKTVTALSIVGLAPKGGRLMGGSIRFKGKEIASGSDGDLRPLRGKEISMIFQDPMTYLNPVMKIDQQIAEIIRAHQKVGGDEARSMAVAMLRQVGIQQPERVAEQYPHQLSGGMRQRVLIAIALACSPSLLIADEPTTALDVTVQAQILKLIRELADKSGISVVLITHDLGVVAGFCDRVYVAYAGKIVEHSDVFSLWLKPMHPYTKGLLDAVLSVEKSNEDLSSIEGRIPDPLDMPSGCRFNPRCPHAMDVCREKEPPLAEVEPNHQVACWLYPGESR